MFISSTYDTFRRSKLNLHLNSVLSDQYYCFYKELVFGIQQNQKDLKMHKG